jgi:glycosyltransferase involved in cell wall biosynthesis
LTSKPLVSVLINNYNYGPFLGEAIDSALSQTYGNVEVVVVDDGSADNSREVIASYGNRIVAVIKENGGQASAFNAGFVASKGEIICFLDSDDLFLPEKVSRVVEIFADNPQIAWCFDKVLEFENGTSERWPIPYSGTSGPCDAREMLAGGRQPFIPTATSGLSFRRDVLALILPMPEIIRITSDGYLKLTALALAEGWITTQELSLQRIHGENAYTKRVTGRKNLAAKTGLLTGVSLHERFPILRRLASNAFAYGLGICWVTGGYDPECRQLTQSFLRNLALPKRAEVLMRAACWSARHLLSRA